MKKNETKKWKKVNLPAITIKGYDLKLLLDYKGEDFNEHILNCLAFTGNNLVAIDGKNMIIYPILQENIIKFDYYENLKDKNPEAAYLYPEFESKEKYILFDIPQEFKIKEKLLYTLFKNTITDNDGKSAELIPVPGMFSNYKLLFPKEKNKNINYNEIRFNFENFPKKYYGTVNFPVTQLNPVIIDNLRNFVLEESSLCLMITMPV